MPPKPKRPRITAEVRVQVKKIDPFLSLSDELMERVFCFLNDDTKSKMRLELVCKKFRTLIIDCKSWKYDVTLKFAASNSGHRLVINDHTFSKRFPENDEEFQALRGLHILLQRMTTIRKIVFDQNHSFGDKDYVMPRICVKIFNFKESFKLEHIVLVDANLEKSDITIITMLISLGLENVKSIELGGWKDGHPYLFACQISNPIGQVFSMILLNCPNLRELFMSFSSHLTFLPSLRHSLENHKHIETMYIDVRQCTKENGYGITPFINSFPKLTTLKMLFKFTGFPGPKTFVDGFSATRLRNITSFGITLNPLKAQHRRQCPQIVSLFPNLHHMQLKHVNICWSTKTTVLVVKSIAQEFHDRGKYQFHLNMITDKPAQVLCHVVNLKGIVDKVIVKDDGNYICYKNDLEIVLHIGKIPALDFKSDTDSESSDTDDDSSSDD